jgi:hypothetical protein
VFDSGQLHYYLFVYLCPDVPEGEADFIFLFYWTVPHPGDRAQDFLVGGKDRELDTVHLALHGGILLDSFMKDCFILPMTSTI